MYDDDVPVINAAMREHPSTFKRGVMFAVLSARQPFNTLPAQFKDLRENGSEARCLFSWKRGAYEAVTRNNVELWRAVTSATTPQAAITILTTVPGLGIVKSAFVAQFLGFDVACLDARNIAREGLSPRRYETRGEKSGRKTGPAFKRLIERYCAETQGRARELWNTWCDEVGPDYGMTGDEASKLHRKLIVPHWLDHKLQRLNAIPF